MTYSETKRELKCKYPPCPCQKCTKLRNGNISNNSFQNQSCDTPPERPLPRYQLQCKCATKLKTIGPKYQRKYPTTQLKPQLIKSEKRKEYVEDVDDCCTGNGCCNTGRNFLHFMINIIGFIAFLIIAALVFWLVICHWVVILGFKVYHSDRRTRVVVVSVIAILFLLIFCTATLNVIRRRSAHVATTPTTQSSYGIFLFKWSMTKENEPTKVEERYSKQFWFKWGKGSPEKHELVKTDSNSSRWNYFGHRKSAKQEVKQQPSTQARSSWMPFFGWYESSSKNIDKRSVTRTTWFSWITSKSAEQPTQEREIHYSWIPSFQWRWRGRQDVQQESGKELETRTFWMHPSSWIPSFISGRKQTVGSTQIEIQSPSSSSSSWTTYFTWAKAAKPSTQSTDPASLSLWSSYFRWDRTPSKPADETQSTTKSDERSFLSYYFRWGAFLWNPSTAKITNSQACKKMCNNISANRMTKQKVTVSISDDEARQIFKQSKFYAIPTEMKQPPKLIIHLRDFIRRSE